MKTSRNEADYEPLRDWALYPSPIRPSGLAQILRGGLVTWLQTAQGLPATPSREHSLTQTTPCDSTPLSRLLAAMIAEVFA